MKIHTLTLLLTTLLLHAHVAAQSDCWDTGAYAFGLLEPADVRGYRRVEIREHTQRRISQTKPVLRAVVDLDANGRPIAYQGIDPQTDTFDYRAWVYDSTGLLTKILVTPDPTVHPFELKATFSYSGSQVMHQRTDFHQFSKYGWLTWGDGGHLTKHISGPQDTTADASNIRNEYRYDNLGRMTANITWVNGVCITAKVAYFDNIVLATRAEEGSRSAVVEEFVLNAQGLPQSATTFREGSKRRRPCIHRTFTYY